MKNTKLYLILTFTAVFFHSCVKNDLSKDSGEIQYRVSVGDIAQTKSAEMISEESFKVDASDFCISVYESEYTDAQQVTKGTPITESLLKTVGQKFNLAAFDKDNPEILYDSSYVNYGSAKWTYNRVLKWPKEGESEITGLDFWAFRDSKEISSYSWTSHKMTFKYACATSDAEHSSDIICAADLAVERETLVSVDFLHALSAIEFNVKDLDSEWLSVKSISLSGLMGSGTCTFDPSQTTSSSKFVWSSLSNEKTYTQTFDPGIKSGESPDKKYTFFVVPQNISDDACLTIVFENSKGASTTLSKNLKGLGTESYLPGKIYTFNISGGGQMSVLLRYNLDSSGASAQNNFTVENNGFVKAYVRAAVTGNWFGTNPVNDEAGKIMKMWEEESTVTVGTNWVRGTDGFYYYTKPLYSSSSTASGKQKITPSLYDQASYAASLDNGDEGTTLKISCSVQCVRFDSSKKYITDAWGSYAASLVSTED